MAATDKGAQAVDPNRRLLRRFKTNELAGLEDGYVVQAARFGSPIVKRLYLQHFDAYQRAVRTVSVVARIELGEDAARAAEAVLRQQLEQLEHYCEGKTRECEALLEANGAKGLRCDHLAPLSVEARVISPMTRRMLTALCKLDDFLTRLNALVIVDVVRPEYGERMSFEVRKAVRRTVAGAVHTAVQIWRAVKRKRAETTATAPAPAQSAAAVPPPVPAEPAVVA